jgi:hypothetical protein
LNDDPTPGDNPNDDPLPLNDDPLPLNDDPTPGDNPIDDPTPGDNPIDDPLPLNDDPTPGDNPNDDPLPLNDGPLPLNDDPTPGDTPIDDPLPLNVDPLPLSDVPRLGCPTGVEYIAPTDPEFDTGSGVENGSFPTLARLFISLFLCFLIAFTSSASAIDLYFSLISALARARACASGDCFLRVSGMYTSTRCPPSPCFTFTNLEYPSLTECADMYINHIF